MAKMAVTSTFSPVRRIPTARRAKPTGRRWRHPKGVLPFPEHVGGPLHNPAAKHVKTRAPRSGHQLCRAGRPRRSAPPANRRLLKSVRGAGIFTWATICRGHAEGGIGIGRARQGARRGGGTLDSVVAGRSFRRNGQDAYAPRDVMRGQPDEKEMVAGTLGGVRGC